MLSLSSNVVTPWARQKCPHFLLSIWEECQTHHCQRDAPSDDKQIRCPSGLKKTAVYLSIFRSLQICWFPWPSKVMDRNTQSLPCGSGVQVELRSPFFKEAHPSSILFSILHIIQLYTSYIYTYKSTWHDMTFIYPRILSSNSKFQRELYDWLLKRLHPSHPSQPERLKLKADCINIKLTGLTCPMIVKGKLMQNTNKILRICTWAGKFQCFRLKVVVNDKNNTAMRQWAEKDILNKHP